MTVADAPFDTGLQAERTMLAWRRTCLALGVASAVGMRLTLVEFGVVSLVLGILGILLALGGYLGVSLRYRRSHRGLVDRQLLATGGRTVTVVAVSGVLLAMLALAWVLAR